MNAPSSCPALDSEFLASVSHGPGVYQMLGRREVLYVGKARDLRKRLAQYAHYRGPAHGKTAVMLARVQRVETILTATEKEALILEAALIKKHRPRYNVILRDDKNYPLIRVTVHEQWPRVTVTRKRHRDGSRYFGPYAATGAMRATLKLVHRLFPLRRCRTMRPRGRPCLNHQMGRCPAPCAGLADARIYRDTVDALLRFLEGKTGSVLDDLKKKMHQAAQELRFEQAARYRDLLRDLERTLEQQVVAASHHQDQDVIGLVRRDASVGLALLFVRAGMISGSQQFFLSDPLGDDAKILTQVLMQYYSPERHPPREILLPVTVEDASLVEERLRLLRDGAVTLRVPRRGLGRRLMAMARTNAAQVFDRQAEKERAWNDLARALTRKLALDRRPDTIECVDISTLGGRQAVGSLVRFVRGEADKTGFRHYRIKSGRQPDDYRMMREVIGRRLSRGRDKKDLPDLLLLDGGKGQLGLAEVMIHDLGLEGRIDLVAIAKEKKDEGEKLFRPGRKNPILLPGHSPPLRYLMRIRDEAHRFGITFHRRLRNKETLASPLDEIPGIGPGRRKNLLRHLGSLEGIRQASPEELAQVEGIGPALARAIHERLAGEER